MIITVVDRDISLEKHKRAVDFHCWLTEQMFQCAFTLCYKQPWAGVPVSVVSSLVDRRLLDHLISVDGHGSPNALMWALQAVIVGSEYVHLAGHSGWGEVCQVLAAFFLLVDLALMAIVAAISRLRTATKTRTKDKKQT